MLFKEMMLVYAEYHMKPINNKKKIQCYLLLKQMVHRVTTQLEKVNVLFREDVTVIRCLWKCK